MAIRAIKRALSSHDINEKDEYAPWRRHVTPEMPPGYIPPPPPAEILEGCFITKEPRNVDVLCGRGSRVNHHPGNVQFRYLVAQWKDLYLQENRRKIEKAHICAHLVSEMRASGGARFLKQSKSKWIEIGDLKARKKVSQALREDAAALRAAEQVPKKTKQRVNHVIESPSAVIYHHAKDDTVIDRAGWCRSSGMSVAESLMRASVVSCTLSYSEEQDQIDFIEFLQDSDRDMILQGSSPLATGSDSSLLTPVHSNVNVTSSMDEQQDTEMPIEDNYMDDCSMSDSLSSFTTPYSYSNDVHYSKFIKLTDRAVECHGP